MPSVLLQCNDTDVINVTHAGNLTCINTVFHNDDVRLLGILVCVGGCLSFLGSSFIIATFTFFKQLRAPALRLVLYLAITDLLSTFNKITNPIESYNRDTCELYPICYVQSVFAQFSTLARIFWVSCIAFNVWTITVRHTTTAQAERMMVIYHAVCWGIPGASVIVVLAAGMSGPAGAWCWINLEFELARLFLLYIWLVLAMVFLFVCYILVGAALRGSQYEAMTVRLRWYVLVFILCNVFSLVNRIQNWASPCHPQYWLYFLQATTGSIQGLCDALVYGANNIVLEQYRICAKRSAAAVFKAKPRSNLEISDSSSSVSKPRTRTTTAEFDDMFESGGSTPSDQGAAYHAMNDPEKNLQPPLAEEDFDYSDDDESL